MNSFETCYEVVCGMDIHKNVISAYILEKGGQKPIYREFKTMTKDLRSLSEWLKEHNCQVVAMESTGVFWKPIVNILEQNENLQIQIINAQHVKNVPGRKTDIQDAAWIARLCLFGLVNGSNIPPRENRELRDLVRLRKSLREQLTKASNQVNKILQSCNIKLSSVISKLSTITGMRILKAIVEDKGYDRFQLAELACGSLKDKKVQLAEALDGEISELSLILLKSLYHQMDFLNNELLSLETAMKDRLSKYDAQIEILKSIPGIGDISAQTIITEIGCDISKFPTAEKLCSWAGMCPGNNISAGIGKSGKMRKGNKYLRAMLNECAWGAVKRKDSHLSHYFNFKKRSIGKKKAIIAVAHSILRSIWFMLTRMELYQPFKSSKNNS